MIYSKISFEVNCKYITNKSNGMLFCTLSYILFFVTKYDLGIILIYFFTIKINNNIRKKVSFEMLMLLVNATP